jgi:hypothetical protein
MKRFLGDGLGDRSGLSAVSTKNDDARVVVFHGQPPVVLRFLYIGER